MAMCYFTRSMRASFELLEPTGRETPVVVEIPHAGLDLAAPFLAALAAPARSLARDADLFVDALYEDAPAEGASLLVARASRYVIDLNRAESDVDAEVVEGARADVRMHHGLIWRTTSDGEPALARKLSVAELEERLEQVWRPYHRTLTALISRKRAQFGVAVVLAAHSMPSVERGVGRDPWGARAGGGRAPAAARGAARDTRSHEAHGASAAHQAHQAVTLVPHDPRVRADVVPGTRGRKSADARFIDAVDEHATAAGWSVRHDDPYAGGFTTQEYGRPAEGVHAIQVELARRLYLDEGSLRPSRDFAKTRAWCRELVGRLGIVALAP
jgi:N-formylglutamate deformylase